MCGKMDDEKKVEEFIDEGAKRENSRTVKD